MNSGRNFQKKSEKIEKNNCEATSTKFWKNFEQILRALLYLKQVWGVNVVKLCLECLPHDWQKYGHFCSMRTTWNFWSFLPIHSSSHHCKKPLKIRFYSCILQSTIYWWFFSRLSREHTCAAHCTEATDARRAAQVWTCTQVVRRGAIYLSAVRDPIHQLSAHWNKAAPLASGSIRNLPQRAKQFKPRPH